MQLTGQYINLIGVDNKKELFSRIGKVKIVQIPNSIRYIIYFLTTRK